MRKRMMGKLRKISTMYYLRQIVACLLVYCILLAVPMQVALATVSNPDVVAGSAGVSQSGNTTTVNMGSASAVINWDSLNTNSSEILQFLKASGNFAVLNRVIQGGATQFDGSLFGNQGHVIIVNPNGIVFGPTALIQAHKFTASALDMANTDFMNGIYNFTGGGVGEVANYGDISADQVALIGRKVLNAGVIRSPGGYVLMAAGDKVFLGQDGSNIVVEVEGVTVPDLAAGIGDVINEGTIEAAGGKIVLAAGDTFSRAIDGLDSMSLAVESGTGRVGQFGILNADGVEGDGGSITMTAGDVVALSSDSVTTANAGTNGDGGDVIVYSPDTALFREGAQIQAKGGSESGDGGFVEVSGKKHVEIHGLVNTTAPQGATGTFLIDPYDIEIGDWSPDETQNGGWSTTDPDYWTSNVTSSSQLDVDDLLANLDNTDVIVMTGGDFLNPNADITVSTAIDYTDGGVTYNDLTLAATDDIIINQPITTGTHDLTLMADIDTSSAGDVDINADITLSGGNFASSGIDFDNTGGDISAGSGAIAINHTGTVTLGADLDTSGTMSGTAALINVASNLAEIQDAIGIADTGGADISVDPGTYDEGQFDIDKPVTLQSTGGAGSTTIKVDDYGICVIADDVTVDGFTVTTDAGDAFGLLQVGADTSGAGVAVDNVTITNNIFENFTTLDTTKMFYYGVAVGSDQSATNIAITDNDFLNLGITVARVMSGILVINNGTAPQGVTISGNVIDTVTSSASGGAAAGIALIGAGAAGVNQGIDVHDNTISSIFGTPLLLSPGIGIYGSTNVSNSGNEIFNSGIGIRIENSGDITVTQDNIHDNFIGIYAKGLNDDVTITQNFISDNVSTGIRVVDTADQLAINYNSITGNTIYGIDNRDTGNMLDATANWWGAANGPGGAGPGSGDAVSNDVDYSPWLGIGADGSGDPGFQPVSPMTWWSNDSIQAAIDAASSGDTVNVVADTYAENVNVNKGLAGLNFMGAAASEFDNLALTNDSDNWDGGVLVISTDNQNLTLDEVTDLWPDEHSLTLDTGSGITDLDGNVTVGEDLTLMSNTVVAADMTLSSYDGHIILAEGKTLTGEGALSVYAYDGDIMLGDDLSDPDPTEGSAGDVFAAGDLTLSATWGSIYAHGELTTTLTGAGGNIELSASDSTIHLYGNVNADIADDGDIIIHNRSEVDDGVILTAGHNVTIDALMTALGDLTIEAGAATGDVGGQIQAPVGIKMPQATVSPAPPDPHDLTLTQTASLHMEAAFGDVVNSDNTNLDATSNGTGPGEGSVTSAEADTWLSIAADASTFISLDDSDAGGDIRTETLTAGTDILIKSDLGKVYVNEAISAGRDVKITAKNESSDAIFLDADVDADRDILLNNNTWAYDGIWLNAGQDVKVGYDEYLDEYYAKTLTGDGELNVEADRHITLGGPVAASNGTPGDLLLKADADTVANPSSGDGIGDMIAYGTITNPSGDIDIYSSDSTTELWDNVILSGDLTLHNNTVMKAAGKILQSTGDDVILAGGKTLDSDFDLTIDAADDILLGITNVANHWNNQHIGSGGDVSANGNMTMTAGDDIYAHGTLTTTASGTDYGVGNIELTASGTTIHLYDDVMADVGDDGDIILHNNTVTADGVVLSAGDDVVLAGGKSITGNGNLTVLATDDVIFGVDTVATHETTQTTGTAGNVTVAGDLIVNAGDSIYAHGTLITTDAAAGEGNIDLTGSGGSTIHLYENVEADITDDGDIILHSNTEVAAGKALLAGKDVTLDDDKSLEGKGDLTVKAGDNITLGGPTSAAGHMKLYADYDIVADAFVEGDYVGNMHAKSSLTTTSSGKNMFVYGQNIQVDGDVDSSGDILMGARDDITLGDLVSEDSVEADGDIWLIADLDASNIDPLAPDLPANTDFAQDGTGNVHAQSNIKTNSSDIYVYGQNIEVDGTVDSSGMIVMAAADNITLEDWVKSVDDMYLYADYDADAGLLGEFVEGDSAGNMYAWDNLETTGSDSDIIVYGQNITVDGDVDSSGDILMGARDHITLGDDDSEDDVEADGDIWLIADLDASNIDPLAPDLPANTDFAQDGTGNVHAQSTITTTGSDVIVYGENIHIEGYVDSSGMIVMGAADNITLDDWVKSVGDMYLYADFDADAGVMGEFVEDNVGKMWAKSSIETTDGHLDVYGENIEVEGFIDIDGTSGGGWIYMEAADNITLWGTVQADDYIELYADEEDYGDGHGLMWAKSSMTTTGLGTIGDEIYIESENIQIDGAVSSEGYIYMEADDSITLGGTVQADDYIDLYADYDDDPDKTGLMWAKSSITTATGNGGYLEVYGEDIQVDGPINIDGWIEMEADDSITLAGTVIAGDDIELYADWDDDPLKTGKMWAKSSITTTADSDGHLYVEGEDIQVDGPIDIDDYIEMHADDDIILNNWIEADYDILISANEEPGAGILHHTAGTIESLHGEIDLSAENSTIFLNGGNASEYVTAEEDIILRNNVWVGNDRKLVAGDDVVLAGGKIIQASGGLTIEAGDDILLGVDDVDNHWSNQGDGSGGNVTVIGNLILTAGDDIHAHGKLETLEGSGGAITATADDNINLYNTPTSADADGTLTLTADSDSAGGGDLTVDGALYGNMELTGVDVTVSGDVVSDGILNVVADENIELRANVSSVGVMTMDAGGNIELNRSSGNTSSDSTIVLTADDEIIIGEAYTDNGNVTANGNMNITAGGDWNDDVLVYGKLTTLEDSGGNITVTAGDDITIWGTWNGDPAVYESVDADGALTMSSNTSGSGFRGGDLYIAGDTIADSMLLEAGSGGPADFSDSRVQVDGLLQTTGGNMVVRAHHDILLGGNVVSAGNLELNADSHDYHEYPNPHIHGGDVDVAGTVDAVGTIDMYGNNIMLDDDVTSGGNMTLTADTSSDFRDALPEGDVVAMGNLTSTGGNIEIYSSDDTTYLGGDRVQAYGNILLNNNTVFTSYDDQKVDAQTGMITANGWLWKDTDGGSLYLEAAGDVSLDDFVKADAGGVSIVSETGTIFTPDEFGDPTDTLNVPITGYSNDEGETGAGVILPYGPGRAAIVVMSEEDLNLGEDAVLTAFGMYDNSGAVDDRAGVGFLDVGDPATATIGGILRNEGDPFDVAIYLASIDGDVDVSGPVTIMARGQGEGSPQGAMVIDAWDTVTFDGGVPGGLFETSLANEDVGDRLEVVSRITEWLFQAVGRLPYPYGGFDFPLDYTYVLRGAGLENPAITDSKRAWVLEDPVLAAPLHEELGEGAERLTLGLEGCPVLLAAAAVELGIPGETIEVSLANSFALNTDIQPCESCARLVNAATILRDEDGSRMAAMNQVFNTVAPAGAPFTPEMAASVVTAFAGRVNDGTQYATAIEYIDAFVRYIAVLSTEMGSPVGDSVAFVIEKYGAGLTESENSNIAAFIATRLESGETFGD